ncbi:acyl-CoA:lysophosphatidylglycerol acyltransferase 1 [Agrilus planipennis]|uniref:Acyl-CoA:lysophosphatidylglycerol acyltransferase 1 n=1 Tax=Agrilus planipennis TaxID=224129 RepID=A0A1W4X6N7_AGRPL|nr:acyl-CoA:lysophosphatidylglycerol acyltransferase 1 [Agrilus planipennis]
MDLRFSTEHWYHLPKALLRLCFILANNLYCIPTYLVWMILLFPLKKVHPECYWKIEGYFFHWLLSVVTLWSWSAGYDIEEMGDDITECLEERTLVIVNHQSTADVPLLMACFNSKKNVLPNLMWIMERLFKYTNFGVVSLMHQDFFIAAGKNNREQSLTSLAAHLINSYLPRHRKWIVLFPEGGFLRKRRETSQRYALKNNLPVLQNVSLPRVGALEVIMKTVGPQGIANNNADDLPACEESKLCWILDVTICYPNGEPLDLLAIVFGTKPPCVTKFFYRLYSSSEVPKDSEGMKQWLFKRFEEKDKILEQFYKMGAISGSFSRNPIQPNVVVQDCLRFIIVHLFFITSTYLHLQMFHAAYSYYCHLMYY